MVRRLLLPALVVALGLAGVASAGLMTSGALPLDPGDPGSVLCPASSGGGTTAACPTTAGQTTTATTATTTTGTTSVATTTTVPEALTTSSAASTLVITGHGWGHGMGMSQWGADGYAQHGWSYARILAHYYRGTTVARGPSPPVKVLLHDGERRVTLASDSPWRVVDGNGVVARLPAGRLRLSASLELSGRALASPLTFSPGRARIEVGGLPYRGKLLVISNGKTMQLINEVGLEAYVDGVVGGEVPADWPKAALEAQAVATRSYALAQVETVLTANPYDLYDDTRSQVYGGIASEAPSILNAVKETARQVVLYHGKVATTYFSASSGGRTVSAAEGIGTPVPYLVSVADPYDTYSPVHDWGPVLFNADAAGKALGLPGELVELDPTQGSSGHNVSATAIGPATQLTLSGAAVQGDLGLRSTWFRVGWLKLDRPSAAVGFGRRVTLAGTVRGVTDVSLESKLPGGDWQVAVPIDPDPSGAFSIDLDPRLTTRYRLAAGSIRAALIVVAVRPVVTAAAGTADLHGAVRPADAGLPVLLQRQHGKAWKTIARGTTGPAGSFTIAARLVPGAYRVRCAPGHGLAPGLSPPLVVT